MIPVNEWRSQYKSFKEVHDKKVRKKPSYEEDDLQISMVKSFESLYPKLKNQLVHVPNGGARSKREGARFKRMGVRAGFPDLIFLYKKASFIEIKTPNGTHSDKQKEYQAMLLELGFDVYEARTVEDFLLIIKKIIDETP